MASWETELMASEKEIVLVESLAQLVQDLERGCRPSSEWKIGTEHEKFGFRKSNLAPIPYDGEDGIRALLEGLGARDDWASVYEGDNIIALKQKTEGLGSSITLEPGGQFELSGAPLSSIHETCTEVYDHLQQVREVADPLDIGFLGLGFSPKWTLAETPRMPKGRYKIMSAYMPKVGKLGLDMMFRSSTVQVNLDFSSEADMVKKFRVSLALQPVVTALFANSPFKEGKPNGYLSYRSELWRDTDPNRSGMLPFVFDEGMSFEAYTDYALDVPMYFIYRNGRYINATEGTFRQYIENRHPGLSGYEPTMQDWADHQTTIFPEVRLKQFLEMRGADGGPWRRLCALPALWVGLLYDETALDAAYDLIKDWTTEERQNLRDQVPKLALKAKFRDRTVQDLAKDIVEIASEGLKARNRLDSNGTDERHFIADLEDIAYSGMTSAEKHLEKFQGAWKGSVDPLFEEHAY